MTGSTTSNFSELPLIEKIGLIGLYAFLFFAWESKARAAVAFMFLLIPCLLDRRFWRDLRGSKTAWVLALLLLYILVRGLAASIEHPEYLHYHLEDGWHLMLLGGFVFIAWLLRGDQHRLLLALSIALFGFWVGRMEHFPWSEALSGTEWWGTREKFGLPSEIGFGLYTASATMGLMLLAPRVWSISGAAWRKPLAITLWGLFLLFSVQGMIMAQTRAVWLSVALLACVLLLFNMRFWQRIGWRKSGILVITITGIVVLIGYANQSAIKKRFSKEMDTTVQLLSGDFEDIQAVDASGRVKSMGVRYHMIKFGIEHWKTSPWFGLGPGISKPLIKEHWVASKKFNHLHNNYLEMLLRLGLVGTMLIFVMLVSVFYGGWRAYREKRIDRDLFMFLVTALTLPLLVSFTSFRMLHADWRYYWFLVGGALYSFSFSKPGSLVYKGNAQGTP
jgi:O-antigen ligase